MADTQSPAPHHHGLAGSIRSCTESETFDLNNQNVSAIAGTIECAFQEPLALQEMIRITFVTGAGKQARQKYDPGASKAVSSALGKCGYQEDRGASCVMECAGTFKLQHDTAKNIKTVVVFPKVTTKDDKSLEEEEPLLPKDSPGYKIAVSSMNVFENMVSRQCPSWSQKKGCLGSIEALKELMSDLDTQLVAGTPLTVSEQEFYGAVTLLDEKESHVKHEAQLQVESGNITEFEKQLLLNQNAERIAALKKENKPTEKALQRKEMLESIESIQPLKLRHSAEIAKLQKELIPLLQLETKGRLMTIKETQLMTRKEEIEEEIEYLQEASRGWFEDDDVFESRVQASRDEFASRLNKRTKKKATTLTGVKHKVKVPISGDSKWVTPGSSGGEGQKGYDYYSGFMKKKSKQSKGSVFGAMMMDSDDEEEEEMEETEQHETGDKTDSGGSSPIKNTNVDDKTQKKSKKKKKKKAKSKQEEVPWTEEFAPKEAEAEDKEETAIAQTGAFLQAYLLPIVVAFVGWLVGLVFGKTKKRGGGQRR